MAADYRSLTSTSAKSSTIISSCYSSCCAHVPLLQRNVTVPVEMMAERGVILVHTTILRWVQHYVPEFDKCWGHYARPVGGSWRCDETYVKVKGQWTYLYRAVDKVGRTVDFYLSERRDVNAAKHFFRKAMKQCWATASDHSRCLRRFTSSSSRVEVGRSLAKACPSAIEQIFKQPDRARSSAYHAADPTDARIQTVRQRGSDDQQYRAYAENSEASI